MEPPENTNEDMKLHLSVLLARGAIIQAFDYQRSKQCIGFGTELLHHLFLGCQEMHKLKDLMYMPLNTLESSMLIKFLSENEDPHAQEALVMYHLLRCNFFEAAKVNAKLSMSHPGKFATDERTAGRDALVEGFLSSVPKAEKNLVEEINRFPSVIIRKTEPLKPLSLSIKIAPLKQITCSDILNSLITGSSSEMCAYSDPQTPLRSRCGNVFENIPFLRPPLTPEPTNIALEAIHSTPVTKRVLTSPSSEFSSPTKKSRLLDNAPFRTPLSKKKIPKHLVGDVASLLQSPPIHRRNSRQVRETSIKDSSAIAPQGILKKKIETSKFPVSDIGGSKTPSVLSDAGQDSDDDDDANKGEMIVDEIHNDAPGRQIRFSVPSKEELNISTISDIDAQSPSVSSISNEPSTFMKRMEKSKPMPCLELFDPDSREYTNITHRQTMNLTREPLKSHSNESPNNQLFSDYEKPSGESTKFMSTVSHHVLQKKLITESDSDSCHTVESTDVFTPSEEIESEKCDSKIASIASTSHTCLTTQQTDIELKETNIQPTLDVSTSEFSLNRSASSGNSSYNSASERSFIITPRKPLRDSSRNSSFSESLSCQKRNEETESVKNVPEVEMIIDDEDICNISDEDISIIGEVAASSNEAASIQNRSILVTRQINVQSVGEIDAQIVSDSGPELGKNDSPEDGFILKEAAFDHEQKSFKNLNQDRYIEAEITDVPIQSDFLIQNVELKEDIGAISVSKDEIIEPEINVASSSIESQVDKPIEDFTVEMYNFTENIPVPTLPSYTPLKERITKSQQNVSEPSYTPLKERISKSRQNVSELNKFDDEEAAPSLLLQEQIDLQKQTEICESRKSNVPEEHSLNVQSLMESSEKLDTVVESSHPMDTDSSTTENTTKTVFPAIMTENKDFSQKLSERFDFLSKNSEFCENNKLYRETMNLLKESDIIQNFEFNIEKKSPKKIRNFVFDSGNSKTDMKTSKSDCLKSKISDTTSSTKEFLESWQPESYKQFSDTIQKGNSESQNEALKSSPNTCSVKNAISIFDAGSKSEVPVSEIRGKKKQDPEKKSTSVNKKQKSAIKKAKEKSKIKKMEFSFAEPNSPAGPEILEVLASPPQYPVRPFMFSPPLTRGRLRQKKLDESMGSSFMSAASETSFAKPKKPPVDPILEEIMAEKAAPELLKSSSSKNRTKSTRKKTVAKETEKVVIPQIELSDSFLNVSKLVSSPDLSTSKVEVEPSPKPVMQHGMVLRKPKGKTRTVKLF